MFACSFFFFILQEHQGQGQHSDGLSSSGSPPPSPAPPLKIAILYGAYHIEDLQVTYSYAHPRIAMLYNALVNSINISNTFK